WFGNNHRGSKQRLSCRRRLFRLGVQAVHVRKFTLGSVHEFRNVLFERELIYAWDGERTSPSNDQRSCLGGAQSSVSRGKAFACGSPCRTEGSRFSGSCLVFESCGLPLAGFTTGVGLLACSLHAISTLGRAGSMAAALAVPSVRMLRPSSSSVDGLHNGTSPPARGRSTKKNGGDQALGRSRGGLSTK